MIRFQYGISELLIPKYKVFLQILIHCYRACIRVWMGYND